MTTENSKRAASLSGAHQEQSRSTLERGPHHRSRRSLDGFSLGGEKLDAALLPDTQELRSIAAHKMNTRLRTDEPKTIRINRMKDALSRVLTAQQDKWLTKRGHPEKAPELPDSDRQLIRECFAMLDADGSGSLEADELAEAFQAVGIKVPTKNIQAMLVQMDSDGSGSLEFDEFESIMGKMMMQASSADGDDNLMNSLVPRGQNINFSDAMQAYRRKKLLSDFMEGGEGRTRIIKQSREILSKVQLQQVQQNAENQQKIVRVLEAAASVTPVVKVAHKWKSANAGNRAARDAPKIEPVEATRRKEQQRLIRRWATFEKQIRTIGDQAIPSFILEAAASSDPGAQLQQILEASRPPPTPGSPTRGHSEPSIYTGEDHTQSPARLPMSRMKIDLAIQVTNNAFKNMMREPGGEGAAAEAASDEDARERSASGDLTSSPDPLPLGSPPNARGSARAAHNYSPRQGSGARSGLGSSPSVKAPELPPLLAELRSSPGPGPSRLSRGVVHRGSSPPPPTARFASWKRLDGDKLLSSLVESSSPRPSGMSVGPGGSVDPRPSSLSVAGLGTPRDRARTAQDGDAAAADDTRGFILHMRPGVANVILPNVSLAVSRAPGYTGTPPKRDSSRKVRHQSPAFSARTPLGHLKTHHEPVVDPLGPRHRS